MLRIIMSLCVIAVVWPTRSEMAQAQSVPGRQARAAILDAAGLPRAGQASSPEVIQQICAGVGVTAELLTPEQLADQNHFSSDRFDLVILATGATFPAAARESLIAFLRSGGHLVTSGGYAFQNLVRMVDGKWSTEREYVAAQHAVACVPSDPWWPTEVSRTRQIFPWVVNRSMSGGIVRGPVR